MQDSEGGEDLPERYATGIVYKITANDGSYYYGSTTKTLACRLSGHLSANPGPAGCHFRTLGREALVIEAISTHLQVNCENSKKP